MAHEDENLSVEEKVERSVARTLGNGLFALVVVGALGAWGYFGLYTVNPGEAAVLLRFGRHMDTVGKAGLHWTLPPPIVERSIIEVGKLESEEFGIHADKAENRAAYQEAAMQTSDNNIVRLSFVVQYRIKDAFAARYRVADPRSVLRDAAQAAMREVVGRMTIDGVLSERRGEVKLDATNALQDILDSYEAGLEIQDVQLQEVQPPPEVRAAFDDVIAATQDGRRAINEAEGYRNEVLPQARAEAAEVIASAEGYRDAKIAEATGEAERFRAVAGAYRKAPDVTRKRLYLETMESVLGDVETIIIEPGTTNVLPYLPLGRGSRGERER